MKTIILAILLSQVPPSPGKPPRPGQDPQCGQQGHPACKPLPPPPPPPKPSNDKFPTQK